MVKTNDSASTKAKKAVAARAAARARALKLKETKAGNTVGGFLDFVREQGVVGLAIGFVLGTQSRMLVDQLVASFIDPLLGLLLPGAGELTDRTFSLTFSGQTQDFAYGAFLFQLITFMIVAAVIYAVFKGLRLDKLDKKKS